MTLPSPLFSFLLLILAQHLTAKNTGICVKDVLCDYDDIIVPFTTSYRELIEKSRMFVDKSLFIKEFIEWKEKVVMIALPLKWGKSINADMLRTFLQLPVDSHGQLSTPITDSYAYKLFKLNEVHINRKISYLKSPLLISNYSDIIDKHLGQYPVVYFSLEQVEGFNDVDVFEQIGMLISDVFVQHKYVLRTLKNIHDNLNETAEERLRAKSNFLVFKRIAEQEEKNEKVIAESLLFLCKMLHMHFQKKVVLIINEYDLPYHRIMHTALFPESDLRSTMKFFNKFYSALSEDNKYLERALLTGTYQFPNIPRAMAAAKGYNLVNNPWQEYFGFTKEEVQELLDRNEVAGETLERASLWYQGTWSGVNLTKRTYNPYSIANFLRVNESLPFLCNRSAVDVLHDVINIKQLQRVFELLVNNNTIDINLHLEFCKKDSFQLKYLFFNPTAQVDKYSHDLVLSYTVASGFLGVIRKENATSPDNVLVEVPNKELLIAIARKLMLLYYKKYGFTQSHVDKTAGNMAVFLISCHYQPSRRLVETMQCMLDHLPHTLRDNNDKEAPENKELSYSLLNFISMKLRHMYKISSEVYEMNSTTYMLTWKKNISSIVAMEFRTDTMEILLEKARQQANKTNKFGHCRVQKFVAININTNKVIELHAGRMETEEV